MSEAEFLPTDQYYIRSEDDPAGRNLREDMSLLPKRVVCPTDTGLELWDIQRLDNGRYKLSARGAPVGAIDNLLFAFLIEQERADEWIITWRKRDERNRNLYTIVRADGLGWVKSTNVDDPQIAVRHILVGASHPPYYSPDTLWNIQALVD